MASSAKLSTTITDVEKLCWLLQSVTVDIPFTDRGEPSTLKRCDETGFSEGF